MTPDLGAYMDPADQRQCRLLGPRDVLDMHGDLTRQLTKPDERLRACYLDYISRDVGPHPEWGASHIHPATGWHDIDRWVTSLGTDLANARTYQVTAEMSDLAAALQAGHTDLADLREEDLPSDHGFMWFDKPVPRPSYEDQPGDEPMKMTAISWAKVPAMPVRLMERTEEGETGSYITFSVPAVRIREWGYNDDPNIWPRPLHLMGQATIPLTPHVTTPLPELWFVHMVWILMGMTIVAQETALPGRQGAKRARRAQLRHALVTVVKLRRTERSAAKPSATPKHIDWSCTWLVRGHNRKAPHGGTFADGRTETWVRPHLKGPDGLPLRTTDILYKLAR
jgi:hypothetical protein